MIELRSVSKPVSPFEAVQEAPPAEEVTRATTEGAAGGAPTGGEPADESRSLRYLVAKGKSGPLRSPFESIIDGDERVRILDTELYPWRMICALRMRSPSGGGAIGTGWFIGPKTVLTAGHCVFSNTFFGGWASRIEVIPGLNGTGEDARPYGSVFSTRFSSLDRWTEREDPDFDVGCIHLDEPLGARVGWFAVGALPAGELESFLVNVSGYPGDRGAGNEHYHNRNRILRVTDRRLFYEADTKGGQSGAPVWIHEDAGAPPLAVGIHAYGIGGTPASFGITANSAPRIIPEVLGKLTEWVAQDGGWPQPQR